MFVPKVMPPFDTATCRPVALVVPSWATYEALKKEIQRLNLSPADYQQAIREMCSALGL